MLISLRTFRSPPSAQCSKAYGTSGVPLGVRTTWRSSTVVDKNTPFSAKATRNDDWSSVRPLRTKTSIISLGSPPWAKL